MSLVCQCKGRIFAEFGGVVRMEYWTKYSYLRETNKVKNVTECKEFRSFY